MVEVNNKTRSRVNERLIKKVAEVFVKKNGFFKYDVSIGIIGDKRMRRLNKVYRKKDKITDVLSFKEKNPKDDNFLGEILINYQQIKRQAKKRRVDTKEELIFILIHGLLHLIGYEDNTLEELEIMKSKGKEFIKKYDKIWKVN